MVTVTLARDIPTARASNSHRAYSNSHQAHSKRSSLQRTPCTRRLTASHSRPDPGGPTARSVNYTATPEHRGTNSAHGQRYSGWKRTQLLTGAIAGPNTHTCRRRRRMRHQAAALKPPTAMPPTQCCAATQQSDTMQVLHSNAQQSCRVAKSHPSCAAQQIQAPPSTVNPVLACVPISGWHVGYQVGNQRQQ